MRLPRTPPSQDAASTLFLDPDLLRRVFAADLSRPTVGDRSLHWDKLRFLRPPKGISLEQWWGAVKLARRSMYKPLPLLDTKQIPFLIALPDVLQRQLSEIDRDLSGRVKIPDELTSSDTRDRYMVS